MKKIYYILALLFGIILLYILIYTFVPISFGYPCADAAGDWAKQINPRYGTCSCFGIKKPDGGFLSYNTYCLGIRTGCYVISSNNTSSFIEETIGSAFTGETKLYSDSAGAGKRYLISVKCDFYDKDIFK